MNTNISELEPRKLWYYFDKISSIPRISKHEKEVVRYIQSEAKRLLLDYAIDTIGNIIIRKPATKGFEDIQTVILQAHVDMVPQKTPDSIHNFLTDAIELNVNNGWIHASNTTLGADNGIGVAAILAILADNDIEHGAIEALFTVEEEIGMGGVFALQHDALKGTIMINTDSEEEQEIIIGCAGGIDISIEIDYKPETLPYKNMRAYSISIDGLQGGHSGIDISLGRGNAIELLWELLNHSVQTNNIFLHSFNAGTMRNAIPRDAQAVIIVPYNYKEIIKALVRRFNALITERYLDIEDEIDLRIEETELPTTLIPKETGKKIFKIIDCIPKNVLCFDKELSSTPETSNNISIIQTTEHKTTIHCLLRSSDEAKKNSVAESIKTICESIGAVVTLSGSYPGWKPNYNSEILKITQNIYTEYYKQKPHDAALPR
ncbi:MAG: beta-Ala-His dipeptidase, partial [Bacteroidales bacterium]